MGEEWCSVAASILCAQVVCTLLKKGKRLELLSMEENALCSKLPG
jgi:hypothetical protein